MTPKDIIIKILNCFENDNCSPLTNYTSIYIYRDGTDNKKQITLGRGFTSMGGSLWEVFKKYKDLSSVKTTADKLLSYESQKNSESLAGDKEFLKLILETSKTDENFRKAQDVIYDELYWSKGQDWFDRNGFTLPLSMAVVQDSFLQSGSIPNFLRSRFDEMVPKNGGSEQKWMSQYIDVRHNWLAHHSRTILNNTVYRTDFFKTEMKKNNWNLDKFPLCPNGTTINK